MNNMAAALAAHYLLRAPGKGLKIVKSRVRRALGGNLFGGHAPSPPTTFIMRVTHGCNLRCKQCGQWGDRGIGPPSGSGAPELSAGEWAKFIRDNAADIPHIYIWGGEPLTKEGVEDMVACASGLGITTEMSTNGTLLAGHARALVDAGLDYLSVSLDGPEEVNNAIRRGEGNVFRKAAAGVEAVLAARRAAGRPVPVVEVCMTLTPENQGSIWAAYEAAKTMGVDVFHLQFGIFVTEAQERESSKMFLEAFGYEPRYWKGFVRDVSSMDAESIKSQVKRIRADARASGKMRYRQSPSYEFDVRNYYESPGDRLGRAPCDVPKRYMQIMPDGGVGLCMDFPDVIAGNVREQDWRNIWANDICEKYRRMAAERRPPACNRCCTHHQTKPKASVFLGP